MTAAASSPVDPGATPTSARALAPDLARGLMLLLIAVANVHVYLSDRPIGVRSYPDGLTGLDSGVAALQILLVDGRAYPLFAFLFGYGITSSPAGAHPAPGSRRRCAVAGGGCSRSARRTRCCCGRGTSWARTV